MKNWTSFAPVAGVLLVIMLLAVMGGLAIREEIWEDRKAPCSPQYDYLLASGTCKNKYQMSFESGVVMCRCKP